MKGRRSVAVLAAAGATLTLGLAFVPAQAATTMGETEASGRILRAITLNSSKKKVPKGKKVKLSGVVTQDSGDPGQCTANQAVELRKKKPSADDFEDFKTVQTNADGKYKAKVKVKKTTDFFASMPQAGDCFLANSDSITVKAKKK